MMKEVTGKLNSTGMKFALVTARFNSFFTEQLLDGAKDCFLRHGGSEKDLTLVRVPGSNDIPLVAAKLAEGRKYDAVIALGVVIQGSTAHADLIENSISRALSELALTSKTPVINAVVATQNLEQAIERAGSKMGNRGWDGVQAAIELVSVLKQL